MKKKFTNILLIIIFTIIVLYFALKDNYKEIIKLLVSSDIRWLFIGYLFVLSYTFLKSIITNNIINQFKSYSIKKTFNLQMMTFFFNAITPFATGGQPFQIYVLKRNKLSLSDSTNIIVQESIIHQIAIIIVCFITLLINYIFNFYKFEGIILIFLILGFSINVFILLLLFILSRSNKIDKTLTKFIVNLLTFLRIIKKKDYIKKIHNTIDEFNYNSKMLLKNKKRFIKLILINCLAFLCLYIVPLTILFSFGNYSSFDGIIAITLVSFISIISSYIPLPGGMGGQEYLFILFFGLYVNQPLLSSLMILWRFVTYYLPMIVGAVIFNIKNKEI